MGFVSTCFHRYTGRSSAADSHSNSMANIQELLYVYVYMGEGACMFVELTLR